MRYATRPLTADISPALRTAHEDLVWLYRQSESDLGIMSNYGAFLGHMMGHSTPLSPRKAPVEEWATAEDQLIAHLDLKRSQDQIFRGCAKMRKIEKTLKRLPRQARLFLDAFFEERQYGHAIEGLFGLGIGAIRFAPSSKNLPTQSPGSLYRYMTTHAGTIERVRDEVHAIYRAILKSYQETKYGHEQHASAP